MPELNGFDLDEIVVALSNGSYDEICWLVDPATAEIVFWSADTGIDGFNPVDLDALDHLTAIDPLPSSVWYRDMVDFTEGISDDGAGRALGRALRGRGAFRRFRDVLHERHPELLPAWYAFRDARGERRAVEWLVDNHLVTQEAAEAFLAQRSEPSLP